MEQYTDIFCSYEQATHLWIELKGKFIVCESKNHEVSHAKVFGKVAWNTPKRGYVDANKGIFTCHSMEGLTRAELRKFENKLEKLGITVCYYKGVVSSKMAVA